MRRKVRLEAQSDMIQVNGLINEAWGREVQDG